MWPTLCTKLDAIFPFYASGGSQGAVRKARGSSTSSAGRRVGTVKEEAREEDTENWPYVKLDPKG